MVVVVIFLGLILYQSIIFNKLHYHFILLVTCPRIYVLFIPLINLQYLLDSFITFCKNKKWNNFK